ncbi:MAG: fumarylacetoacetate hydrolase family protein [Ktedonobacteraceae bacterium]|nr:fumarylacetoacetate hydrolase family protein [Ktedonobacteraceae bacterium]
MKLVTFRTADRCTHAGVIRDERILVLNYPTLLELLQDADGLTQAWKALSHGSEKEVMLNEVVLLSPLPEPPAIRDFYAFEQHVKTARGNRGLDMIPEWYEIPIFYFSNTSEVYGNDQQVPDPAGSRAVDFELEVACVIGREGKDIAVEAAASYIAGYTIMNDWSARDFQLQEMKLNLGPSKGKDFATSLGPWLVTPDELAMYRHGQGAMVSSGNASSERYDMTMLARINGKEVSRGNFNQIYYSFPQMIAWASRNARLRPGDILGSGTVGTGCILELGTEVHPWLQREDVVELEVEGIGVLRNRIV